MATHWLRLPGTVSQVKGCREYTAKADSQLSTIDTKLQVPPPLLSGLPGHDSSLHLMALTPLQELERQLEPTQAALEQVRSQWAAAQTQVPDLQRHVATLQQQLASEANASLAAKAALLNSTQGALSVHRLPLRCHGMRAGQV